MKKIFFLLFVIVLITCKVYAHGPLNPLFLIPIPPIPDNSFFSVSLRTPYQQYNINGEENPFDYEFAFGIEYSEFNAKVIPERENGIKYLSYEAFVRPCEFLEIETVIKEPYNISMQNIRLFRNKKYYDNKLKINYGITFNAEFYCDILPLFFSSVYSGKNYISIESNLVNRNIYRVHLEKEIMLFKKINYLFLTPEFNFLQSDRPIMQFKVSLKYNCNI